ncbi:MAG: Glu/Leu/Phe/Val dehydrogenase dimerization domain-containing protein [Alphaproteobacteria bacterium]
MGVFDAEEFDDHEQVVFGRDAEAALVAIVAIHDTSLGPALGGCRMWPYASEREALADVLRLSKAMTYKHALAGTAQGGGKAVIIADPKRDKSPALWHALGRLVDGLSGRYIVAEDVGTSVEDMALVHEATPHVAGIADGGSGDPSPMTAWGVFCGIKAAVHHKLGRDDLAGLRVAVQGLGHVGHALCGYLHDAGARLLVSDIDEAAVENAIADFGAEAVAPEQVHAVEAEVFAPCALGGVLNETTIPEIKAPIVAGTANNQLSCAADGEALAARGVLYAPDYAINAGGVVNISFERDGYEAEKAMARTAKIYDTLTAIFERADAEGVATNLVADRMARERIEKARAKSRETNPAVKRG